MTTRFKAAHYVSLFCLCFILKASSTEKGVLEHASVSMYAIHMPSGKVLIDESSDKSLNPSSSIKIFTTAAALHILGPKAHFVTTLEYDGTIDEQGALHGNVYIRGGGDPCLGSERTTSANPWQKQLDLWINALQRAGIRKIEGAIIGDASLWEKALAVPSWQWEDIGNYYGAGASALTFHENYYTLYFRPGKTVGEKATIIKTVPAVPHLTFQNEVTTGPIGSGDQACIYGMEFFPVQYVRGTVPAGVTEFAIKGAIPDPASFCAKILSQALQVKGIIPTNQPQPSKQKRTVLHTTISPSIEEIVYWTNQKSVNLYAEHLLKKMGEIVGREGSTSAGIKAITNFWKARGLDLNGFNLADGSGLSRKNLVTAKQFVAALCFMKNSPYFAEFYKSLPAKTPLIHAKSGSMSLARGYAGYAGDIAFAILINQCPDSEVSGKIIDQFFAQIENLAGNNQNL